MAGNGSDGPMTPEPDPLAPLLAAIRDLLAWLQASEVRGLIIGGVAASLLGRPRLTHDVDVLVMLDQALWPSFLAAAQPFHFVARVEDPVAFARRSRVLPVHHRPSAIDVDVILGALSFERQAIARARAAMAGGVSLPVATPEDLVVMKMVAHRPQDLLDIDSILDAQPGLDFRRIRRWLREFSAAMDMPELLEELEALLARRRRRRRPTER